MFDYYGIDYAEMMIVLNVSAPLGCPNYQKKVTNLRQDNGTCVTCRSIGIDLSVQDKQDRYKGKTMSFRSAAEKIRQVQQ